MKPPNNYSSFFDFLSPRPRFLLFSNKKFAQHSVFAYLCRRLATVSLMESALRRILLLLWAAAVLSASAAEERTFAVINAASGLADNSAQAVVCTKAGRMIISTLGNLNFYNGATFSHIVTRHEHSTIIRRREKTKMILIMSMSTQHSHYPGP